MSPRARTSVLDLWSGSKDVEKEWIWMNWWCWLGFLGGELHWLWFTGCSCSPFQCCNLRWFWVLRLGILEPRVCLLWLVLYHLHWFSGTRPGGHWAFAVNCREHAAHLRCRQEVCRVGWGAVSRRDDLTIHSFYHPLSLGVVSCAIP